MYRIIIPAKVRTLFERIMAQDNNTYKDLFRPYARRIIWFGENFGKVQTPDQAAGDLIIITIIASPPVLTVISSLYVLLFVPVV